MLTAAPVTCPVGALRATEFGRLDAQGLAYLDYAGSAIPAASQLDAVAQLLGTTIFGNPHSGHAASRASTEAIEQARERVVRFLDAPPGDYAVCFTANTSAAIKLVAESYAFGPKRGLILSADNHNSVNGMREYARRAGAPVSYMPLDPSLRLRDTAATLAGQPAGLVAFPAQSNFSGVKHPLSLVHEAHRHGHDVLLDLAALVPASPFSLRACPADFAALSFYKVCGYPSGVGALVAKRSALARLARPWFAGGTVAFVSVSADMHRLLPLHEGFEDGTPNFAGIACLAPGLDFLERTGLEAISHHVRALTMRLLDGVGSLRHRGGMPVASIYGPHDAAMRGGTVAFNVLDAAGAVVPFDVVERRAHDRGVALRGGCFCNPGASEAAFAFEPARTARCLATLGDSFTVERFAACLGRAHTVGAVRASIGTATSIDDVERLVDLVASFRDK